MIESGDLRAAAWNNTISLVYFTSGFCIYSLVNVVVFPFFRKSVQDLYMEHRPHWIQGALMAVPVIYLSLKQSDYAHIDLVPIPEDKMIQLFAFQAVLAVAIAYFFKAYRFALLVAAASSYGYIGKIAVVIYGSAGAYSAYELKTSTASRASERSQRAPVRPAEGSALAARLAEAELW